MTKTETSAYAAERVKYQTAPTCLVRFFHLKRAGDVAEYPFSRDFATGPVVGAGATILPAIDRIVGNTQTVAPEQGRSSRGTFDVYLVDVGGEILKQLSNPSVTLQTALGAGGGETVVQAASSIAGYPAIGTVEIDSERIRYTANDPTLNRFTGITRAVDDTSLAAHAVGATIRNGEQIRSGQRVQLFAGYASLSQSHYTSLVKMEIVRVGLGPDGLTFIVTITDVQRWLDRAVFLGATEENPVSLTGNPVTLALQVLTSTGLGTNGAYDVLAAVNGLAVPQALVDVAGLESLRDEEFAGQTYEFKLTGPGSGKEFLEGEIWHALNCYPWVTQDGKYSAKRYKPAPASASLTLTEADILSWQWQGGEAQIVNQIEFQYDWHLPVALARYSKRQRYTSGQGDGGSYDKYGPRPLFRLASKGIKTATGGQAILDDRAAQFFKRYADPPPVLSVGVRYGRHELDVGDVVAVTHARIPNRLTGLRGLAGHVFEVIDLQPFFGREGKLQLILLFTGAIVLPSAPASGGAVNDAVAPAAPTAVTATPSASIAPDGTVLSTATVSWTAPGDTDLVDYEVFYKIATDPTWLSAQVGSTETTVALSGLKAGASYQFKVRAIDRSGNLGTFSGVATQIAAGDVTVPAAPTGLAATVGTGKSVSLAWAVNTEEDRSEYGVYRHIVNNPATATKIAEVGANRFVDVDVVLGMPYWYWVTAIDTSEHESEKSSGVPATPALVRTDEASTTPPNDPAGATKSAQGTYLSGDGAVLAYFELALPAMPSGAVLLNALIKLSAASQYQIAGQVGAGGVTVRIDDLTPGQSYDLAVQALTAFGIGSGIVKATSSPFTAPGDTVAPSDPTAIAVRQGGAKVVEIDLTFTEPADWGTVELYRNTTNDSGTATVIDTKKAKRFHDQNVTYGQIYYYWGKLIDLSGNKSGFSPSSAHSITVAQVVTGDITASAITAAAGAFTEASLLVSASTETDAISVNVTLATSVNVIFIWAGLVYVSGTWSNPTYALKRGVDVIRTLTPPGFSVGTPYILDWKETDTPSGTYTYKVTVLNGQAFTIQERRIVVMEAKK